MLKMQINLTKLNFSEKQPFIGEKRLSAILIPGSDAGVRK